MPTVPQPLRSFSAAGPRFGEPRLLADDGGVFALYKPSGFAVHATGADAAGEAVPDLIGWAREHLGAPAELAPIHRLDRETSGAVLCAADADLRARLGRWFADGEVHKRYQALVFGHTHRKGVIRRPLKDPRRRRTLEAVTRYQAIERFARWTLLSVVPETGRRHQIRRHLQGLGHAVVGDRRYRPRRLLSVPGFPGRLWLHAAELALPDGRRYAVALPPELEAHLALLRGGDAELTGPPADDPAAPARPPRRR